MDKFSKLLVKSNAKQYEQSFRAVMTLAPAIILSETAIFEETNHGVLSWSTLESNICNSQILRDMSIVNELVHCVDVLHYYIQEHYDYPFVQFTMGNIVLARLINSCPKQTDRVGICLDIDQYASHLQFVVTNAKTCNIL